MHPEIHAIFDGLAILLLAVGAHIRLRQHPAYSTNLLMDGLLLVVWSGAFLAWFPNIIAPLRSVALGHTPSADWWRSGFDNWMLGVAGGLIAGVLFLRYKRIPVPRVLDAFAPLLALTLAVWRIGCAINGDAYGKITDSVFGMWLPDTAGNYAWRYPTQFVSLAMNLFIAAALLCFEWFARKIGKPLGWPFHGFLFGMYVIVYCVQRFLFEFWRGDKATVAGPFTATHVYCIVGIILAALFLRRASRPADREGALG